jgi:hypothetical protein
MAAKRPVTSSEIQTNDAGPGDGAQAPATADPILAAPDSSVVEALAAANTEEVQPLATVPAAAPAQQVVYVEAPKPFVKKGNRVFGVLIALLSTVIFAAVYAVALVIDELVERDPSVDFSFVGTLDFYAPVLMFAVGFVILVLIVNRAGWAAHVIGSIFVALVVFFGGTGVILLLHVNSIPSNEVGAAFRQVLLSATLIIAALLGREVSLWMGFAIAARGRKVKARNVDAKVLYDQEIAAKRAEYEQANAAAAAGTGPVVEKPTPVETVPASDAVEPEDAVAP